MQGVADDDADLVRKAAAAARDQYRAAGRKVVCDTLCDMGPAVTPGFFDSAAVFADAWRHDTCRTPTAVHRGADGQPLGDTSDTVGGDKPASARAVSTLWDSDC